MCRKFRNYPPLSSVRRRRNERMGAKDRLLEANALMANNLMHPQRGQTPGLKSIASLERNSRLLTNCLQLLPEDGTVFITAVLVRVFDEELSEAANVDDTRRKAWEGVATALLNCILVRVSNRLPRIYALKAVFRITWKPIPLRVHEYFNPLP
jgi:hypothetical protein